MKLFSKTLSNALINLDNNIAVLEEKIESRDEQIKELQEKISKINDESFAQTMKNAGNLLSAITSTPDTIDPSSGVILDKILRMEDIKDVHSYIKEIFNSINKGK
jgi:hypothetical protein